MAQPSRVRDAAAPEGHRRAARAQRILDAASGLIQRHGYHETTIDDIAREAGVGKGTLYLHWKTRAALFEALIVREKIAMAADIQRRLAGGPAGALLHTLIKHSALALLQRPLLKAVLLRDSQVFGKLAHSEHSATAYAEVLAGFTSYLRTLREQGLVRTDLALEDQAAVLSSIFLGFLLAAPLLPGPFQTSDEKLAELMAETVQRTLEPRDPATAGAVQITSDVLAHYLDHSVAIAQEQVYGDAPAGPPAARPPGRARGRKGGRSKVLATTARVAEARRLYADKSKSIEWICAALGISRASLYRYVKDARDAEA